MKSIVAFNNIMVTFQTLLIFFESFKIPEIPGFECFSGGLVGYLYLGYETIRYIEERLAPNIQAIWFT